MANQEELLEAIGGMTVLELSEFVDAFKEKFNVTAVAAPVAVAGGAAAGGAAGEAEAQDEFDVVLVGIGDKKIQVIKVVRELTGLGLKEAKDLVDGAPNNVKEAATKEEAEEMKAKLDTAQKDLEQKNKTAKELEEKVKNGDESKKESLEHLH